MVAKAALDMCLQFKLYRGSGISTSCLLLDMMGWRVRDHTISMTFNRQWTFGKRKKQLLFC